MIITHILLIVLMSTCVVVGTVLLIWSVFGYKKWTPNRLCDFLLGITLIVSAAFVGTMLLKATKDERANAHATWFGNGCYVYDSECGKRKTACEVKTNILPTISIM